MAKYDLANLRGKVQTMTPTAFQQWCKQLALPASTCKPLVDIRSGDPVRRVTSRASNMSGAYPSDKMGITIQFESHKVEFWAILAMEHAAGRAPNFKNAAQ